MKKTLLICVAIFALFIFGQNVMAADWQTTIVDSANTGEDNSIAVDSNSYVHIAYVDAGNLDLKYATNQSGSWVASVIDSTGMVGLGVSIKMDSNNKAHISYIDETNSNLKYATNASGSWVVATVDNSGTITVGFFDANITSIALSNSNVVSISYYDSTNNDLKYTTNATGSWVLTTVDSGGDVGNFNSIDIDSNGYAHISYADTTNDALKYATNVLSGAWATFTLDDGSDAGYGWYTSLALDSNDDVHISYFDATNSDLKYITNAPGLWVATSLDTSNQSGYCTAIAIDSNNVVRIGYYELVGQQLKYATNFSGSWTYSVIEDIGPAGMPVLFGYYNQIAIAVDSRNRANISYLEADNADLKYAYTPGPTISSSEINSGRDYSAYRNISIESSLTGSPTEMIVSENSDFTGASWETYSADKTFKLSSAKGKKTVYVKFRDSWYAETAVVSQAVKYVGNPKFVTKNGYKSNEVKVKTKSTKYYGKDYYLVFKKYPSKFKNTKRYFLAERQNKYPKTFANAKNNLLKKYWKVTTDFNKYKSSKKTRLKLVFEYTTAEFKVLKKKTTGLKEKDLYLKFYDPNTREWRDLQVAPDTTNHKFTVYFNSPFKYSTFYYAIGR